MSNEKQETMADIIVEMRHGLDKSLHDIDREWAHGLSDRIETAWRREMAKVEANALEVGGIVAAARTAEKSSAVGNAAAMREACQKMRDLLMLRGDGKARCVLTWDEFNESQKMLRAALSAPARNCDRPECATSKAAQNVWRKEDGGKTPYYEWLLAPEAERKGATV